MLKKLQDNHLQHALLTTIKRIFLAQLLLAPVHLILWQLLPMDGLLIALKILRDIHLLQRYLLTTTEQTYLHVLPQTSAYLVLGKLLLAGKFLTTVGRLQGGHLKEQLPNASRQSYPSYCPLVLASKAVQPYCW